MLNMELCVCNCVCVDNTPFEWGIELPSSWEEENKKPHIKKPRLKKNYKPVKILFIAVKFTLALVLAASSSSS